MKTQNNNGTVILFAVLGIAGLYYLFSRKSEKQDNTYQVLLPSNVDLSTSTPSYKTMSYNSYSDVLLENMKRTKELTDAGVDPLTLPIQ